MTLIAVTKDHIYVDEMVTVGDLYVNYQSSAKIMRIGREGILLTAGIGTPLGAIKAIKDILLEFNDPNITTTKASDIANRLSSQLLVSEDRHAGSYWTYVTKTHIFTLTIGKHAIVAMYLRDELIDGKAIANGSGNDTFRIYLTRGYTGDHAAQAAVIDTPTCGGNVRKLNISKFFQSE